MFCYGIKNFFEGDWYCIGCKEGVIKGLFVSCGIFRGICVLCLYSGGVFVRVVLVLKFEILWFLLGYYVYFVCVLYLFEVVMCY